LLQDLQPRDLLKERNGFGDIANDQAGAAE
jgi:hypothetical protein